MPTVDAGVQTDDPLTVDASVQTDDLDTFNKDGCSALYLDDKSPADDCSDPRDHPGYEEESSQELAEREWARLESEAEEEMNVLEAEREQGEQSALEEALEQVLQFDREYSIDSDGNMHLRSPSLSPTPWFDDQIDMLEANT